MKQLFQNTITILLAGLLLAVSGCLFDRNEEAEISDTGDNTPVLTEEEKEKNLQEQVTPQGTRKPRSPRVEYETFDSLVTLSIFGAREGEERFYWIFRNNTLLEVPTYKGKAGTEFRYMLVDSVPAVGTYNYQVRYGEVDTALSEPSKTFTFTYEGKSRSGTVALRLLNSSEVRVTLQIHSNELITKALFERRIGENGPVTQLDTIIILGSSSTRAEYHDTAVVLMDTLVYYRAKALDAFTEQWLPPTPWASVRVENNNWKYLPTMTLTNRGVLIEVKVTSIPMPNTTYYLYRNGSDAKEGKVRVDSLIRIGSTSYSPSNTMSDAPDAGTYFYWVEAVDRYNRASPRSLRTKVVFTGKPIGPAIFSLLSYPLTVRVRVTTVKEADSYILARSEDSTKNGAVIDTIPAGIISSSYVTYYDRPSKNGKWFYRACAVINDSLTEWGESKSTAWTWTPTYSTLSGVTIINMGNTVEAQFSKSSGYVYTLYRSPKADRKGAVKVDELNSNDFRTTMKDTPALGAHYYWVERWPSQSSSSGSVYRSTPERVDFTGKAVGPPIYSLTIQSGYITVKVRNDNTSLAYIIERTADPAKGATVLDTLPSTMSTTLSLNDRPPSDGYWYYRVKVITAEMKLSEPGQWKKTASAWTFRPTYSTISANIINKGSHVAATISRSTSYTYYLYRSPNSNRSDSVLADQLPYSEMRTELKDIPALGNYYYWVERTSQNSSTIYRSSPTLVEFTGQLPGPTITSITVLSTGLQLSFSNVLMNDTLEIWKSTVSPTKLETFTIVELKASGFSVLRSYTDITARTAGFYHYRLIVRRAGVRSGWGPAKSQYRP